ncbi:MAG: extracellular solute-binding protein [Ktedonobacteraceae bacterium]|nr:extracellular solute-binding protein [Ktedonobacteraceae bacterium]
MQRTIFRMAMLAVLAMLVLAGCGSTGSGSTKTTLSVYASGDVNVQKLWQNTLIPDFKKAHPDIDLKLVFSEHGVNDTATFSRLSAAVSQNKDPGMDIMEGITTQAVTAKLLHPLTTSEVPLLSHVDNALIQQANSMAIPYRASSVVLAYNSQFVKDPPKTLSDLLTWIKAHPGKFTYNSPNTGGSGSAFVQAVLRSNLSQDQQTKFTTGDNYDASLESQWQPGLGALKALKPAIYNNGFYPNGNTAVLQLLGNSSIWVAPVWSDQALTALSTHQLPDSVKLLQISPPFSGGPAFIGIPKTSQHIKEATMFLNWILDSNVQAKIVDIMSGYPGVQWSYLSDQVRQKYASIASSYATTFSAKYGADVNKQWQTQVAGG